ncbi:hypothetical protein N7474_004913 [Penicillium riverlandense]|uniref:uncharacterized protein n=1 Tax=Penicillium riverlandense TaxID=1903569 RepID=UPI0025470B17|nr:uncharacterized protein N7474_004913 [Penicillium riverlandense]KAJ5819322.1 hypothetical protein N7474_004913 [Penicillium riverlandense]
MSRPSKNARNIACARCFRLKRKCDHVKPVCGECRRKGAECLPAKSRLTGESVTIPLEYLKQLEERVAELDAGSVGTMCDAAVQTDAVVDGEVSRSQSQSPVSALRIPWNTSPDAPPSWNGDSENDGALVLIPESYPRRGSRHSSPFADAFSLLDDTAIDFPYIDTGSLYPTMNGDDPWLLELYSNLYFSISNREWPFLNESAWKSWHSDWLTTGQDEDWRGYFLQMVYAIGASLCSTLQRDPTHSTRSKELYSSAMRFYPHVVAQSSTVLQIQASILMILYTMHSPSIEEMTTSVSSVMPFCTAAIAEIRKYASAGRDSTTIMSGSDESLAESMFITCYMLNEIVVSGWDRPVSAAYRAVDDDMRILGDAVQPPDNSNPALSHLFRLRKIQANIRRLRENQPRRCLLENDDHSSSIKSALDVWRQDIPRYGSEIGPCGYLHPVWMAKLYDYSVLILMEEKRDFLEHDGTEDILSAIVEVCLSFRRLQEEGHVMCYTWSALVFQFRAGIMLLYIVWSTTRQKAHIESYSLEAIPACATTLSCFANRWADALPYTKLFDFLHQKVLDSTSADMYDTRASVSIEDAEFYLEQLKKRYLHRAVLDMIEEMMYGEFLQITEISDVPIDIVS